MAALSTRLTLSTVLNCVGVGFHHGPYANWQLGPNDRIGAPTLIDRYASFPVASLAIAASVTRKAFTNESMLERLDCELGLESKRIDRLRADDRKPAADRLERIETDIRTMRDVMFEAFPRGRTD